VEEDDLFALVRLDPVIARNERVVLVGQAVALLPLEVLAARDVDPPDEPVGRDIGLGRPRANEVDDLVARVGCDP